MLLATCVVLCGCAAPRAAVERTVPSGTAVRIEMLDSVSSADSAAGESFQARVVNDVIVDGAVAIPAGSEVSGRVVSARGLKKIGGRAQLTLEFTSVTTPTGDSPLRASWSRLGKSETKKDAAIIGGSTAGGALLGRALSHDDKGKGTLLGAIVGGGAGTAIAAGTKGEEIHLPSGSQLTVHLQGPVTLRVEA